MKKRFRKNDPEEGRKEPYAEGLTFPFERQDKIGADVLMALPYRGMKQLIKYRTSEFTAVCPFSGLPDQGMVIIEYIPNRFIVELKSLKYYFVSYRNVGIYQEDATSRIFQDLHTLLKPKYMKLTTFYNTRGGIDSTCSIEKGRK